MSQNSSSSHQATAEGKSKNPARSLKIRIFGSIAIALWVIAAFLLAEGLTLLLARGLVFLRVPLAGLNEAVLNAALGLVGYAFTIIITIFVPWKFFKRRTSKKQLGFDDLPTWTDITLGPTAFIPYVLLSFLLTTAFMKLYPGFQVDQVQEVGFSNLTQRYEYILAFLTLVVLAPIVEELLFRGYLYGKLKPLAGRVVGALLTSLIFAALHLQLNVGIDVFAMSLVLCSLRELTGTIWAGVILHMIKNGVAFYVLFVLPMIQ